MKYQIHKFGSFAGLLLTIVFLFTNQSFAQTPEGVFAKDRDVVEVDLLQVDGLSLRMNLYDAFRVDQHFEVGEITDGKFLVRLKNHDDEILLASCESVYNTVYQADESRDKFASGLLMEGWMQKYGDGLMNQIMGRETINDSCRRSLPFCTTNIYTFPAGVNSGNAEAGNAYGCLNSQPNPAWYHMKILTPGQITIKMQSFPLEDIDYIVWGPFTDPVMPCSGGLTASKIVSCSYSPNSIEFANIPNGQTGQYYILLITNFSNDPCEITFSKTGGPGETDCTILPPPISSNSPVCYGSDLHLYAETYPNATYSWTGPNGFTSSLQNPTIPEPDFSYAGTYSLEITVDNITSDPIQLVVVIAALSSPDFDVADVCYGNPNEFFDQSTVNPPEYEITSRLWDFGDGSNANTVNPQHTYSTPGTYDVTLTTYTGLQHCAQSVTKQVVISEYPYVNAGENQEIANGWTTTLEGEANGGSEDLTIQWEPQNLVVDPNSAVTATVSLTQTTLFTLTVTDNVSGCTETDEVIVNVTGGALFVQTIANPDVICLGESVQLTALPSGGAGDYTITWSSNPAGFNSNISDPVVEPTQTTTYTVQIFDGQITASSAVTVTVKPMPAAYAGSDMSINVGTAVNLDGSGSGGSGSYSYSWSPADSLNDPQSDPFLPNPLTKLLNVPTTYHLTIHDANGCSSESDAVTVFTGGDYLAVYAQTDDEVICFGQQTQLSATALGGSGSYSYSWTTDNNSWSSNQANPFVSPASTTIYTVVANDGFKNVTDQITVVVNPLPVVDIKPATIDWYAPDTINMCVRDSVWLDAGANMEYIWSNGDDSRKIRVTTNGNWIDFQTWTVEVTNPVTACVNYDTLTIFFDFNACNIGLNELEDVSSSLKIAPNPAVESVRVKSTQLHGGGVLYLFTSGGKLVYEIKMPNNSKTGLNYQLDLNHLESGAYMIFYRSDKKYAAKQLIITK